MSLFARFHPLLELRHSIPSANRESDILIGASRSLAVSRFHGRDGNEKKRKREKEEKKKKGEEKTPRPRIFATALAQYKLRRYFTSS
jgi:hypothetical protein